MPANHQPNHQPNNQLELRVLTGLQAGARLALAPGAYTLGRGDDCDIVLSGEQIEARHAGLEVRQDDFSLSPLAAACSNSMGQAIAQQASFAPGQLFRLGPVWLTADHPAAPWPPLPQLPQSALSPRARKPASWRYWGWILFALLPLTGVTVFSSPYSASALDLQRQVPQGSIAAQATRLKAWLQQQENAEHLSVTTADGQLQLSGYLPSAAALSSLATVLKSFPAPVNAVLFSEEGILQDGQRLLDSIAADLHLENLGQGQLRLTGAAAGQADIEEVLFRLQQIPGIQQVVSEVLLPPQLALWLKQAIDAAGLPVSLKVTAGRDRLTVSGDHLPAQDRQVWRQVQHSFEQQWGQSVPLQVDLGLPFRIRSISRGTTPYLVTNGGDKLFPGGSLHGLVLLSIENNQLLFQGEDQQSIKVTPDSLHGS